MSKSSGSAKKLAAIIKQVTDKYESPPPAKVDPVTQMVLGFLEWNATRKQAAAAHERLMQLMVDNNDLRVSHLPDIVGIIGPEYPLAQERVVRMHESLQEIFIREHVVTLDHLGDKAPKTVSDYLGSLAGMTPYVSAQVTLLAFNHPAVPVDEHLFELLMDEEAADEEWSLEELAEAMEKHTKPAEAAVLHHALRAWVDDKYKPKAAGIKSKKPAPSKKKPAGKV